MNSEDFWQMGRCYKIGYYQRFITHNYSFCLVLHNSVSAKGIKESLLVNFGSVTDPRYWPACFFTTSQTLKMPFYILFKFYEISKKIMANWKLILLSGTFILLAMCPFIPLAQLTIIHSWNLTRNTFVIPYFCQFLANFLNVCVVLRWVLMSPTSFL